MKNHLNRVFIYSTAAFLLLTAVAKLYSATGTARILTATDPLFHVANRQVMLGAGLMEVVIALYLLMGRNVVPQIHLIFWLSSNFILYRFGLHYIHYKACPCLGTLGAKLPLTPESVNRILEFLVLYWFLVSACLVWQYWNREEPSPALTPT